MNQNPPPQKQNQTQTPSTIRITRETQTSSFDTVDNEPIFDRESGTRFTVAEFIQQFEREIELYDSDFIFLPRRQIFVDTPITPDSEEEEDDQSLTPTLSQTILEDYHEDIDSPSTDRKSVV